MDMPRNVFGEATSFTGESTAAPRAAVERNFRWLVASLSLLSVATTLAAGLAIWRWREADARVTKATHRVYTATLEKLETVLDTQDRKRANEVFAAAVTAHRDAYGDDAGMPVELAIIKSAIDRSLKIFRGHEADITALAYSPDGTRLATASVDGTARIWDAATGATLAVLEGHRKPIACLAFSPDGRSLATGSEDGTARVWNTATGAARSSRVTPGRSRASRSVPTAPVW